MLVRIRQPWANAFVNNASNGRNGIEELKGNLYKIVMRDHWTSIFINFFLITVPTSMIDYALEFSPTIPREGPKSPFPKI